MNKKLLEIQEGVHYSITPVPSKISTLSSTALQLIQNPKILQWFLSPLYVWGQAWDWYQCAVPVTRAGRSGEVLGLTEMNKSLVRMSRHRLAMMDVQGTGFFRAGFWVDYHRVALSYVKLLTESFYAMCIWCSLWLWWLVISHSRGFKVPSQRARESRQWESKKGIEIAKVETKTKLGSTTTTS